MIIRSPLSYLLLLLGLIPAVFASQRRYIHTMTQYVAGPCPSAASFAPASGKRGLAYDPTSPPLSVFEPYPQLTWAHNWGSAPASLPAKYDYVLTLWSNAKRHTKHWDDNVQVAKARGGITYLMSFNEPDIPSQANMPVDVAVLAYRQYLNGYASPLVKLGSPSVSNAMSSDPDAPMGIAYLSAFLDACDGCTVDFVPVHWYGCPSGCPVADDVAAFKTNIEAALQAARGKPVWITEFQKIGDAREFLNDVLPWLDAQGQIARYAYFMVADGILTSNGGLSELGKVYSS